MTKKQLADLRPHDNNMYAHVKRLTNSRSAIPPLERVNGETIYSSVGKADCLLRISYFPDAWKIAKITAICKPGKPPDLPGSYRSLSLLPIASKACEVIVANHIMAKMR